MFTSHSEERRAKSLLGNWQSAQGDNEKGVSRFAWVPPLQSLFQQAGLSATQAERFLLIDALTLAGVVGLALVLRSVVWLGLVPIILLLSYWSLSRRAQERLMRFENDYTALLLSLASTVKAGLDPLAALLQSSSLFRHGSEVEQVIQEMNELMDQGLSERQATLRFGESIAHPDLGLFRTAFLLARQEGASLADCLRRLAKVTRQRQSFRRKIRSAIAMQKLSAFGIGGCALVIAVFQGMTNGEGLNIAIAHPLGSKLLLLGVALMIVGLVWMACLARVRI